MKDNISLDLETLDVPGFKKLPIVLSIGAVRFDQEVVNSPQELIGGITSAGLTICEDDVFYSPVSLLSSMKNGCTYTPNTADFWSKQDYNMVAIAASADKLDLRKTLLRFAEWLERYEYKRVWANAPTFDIRILGELFESVGLKNPFTYYRESDFRTVTDFLNFKPAFSPGLTKHHALHDAAHEAHVVQKLRERVKRYEQLEAQLAEAQAVIARYDNRTLVAGYGLSASTFGNSAANFAVKADDKTGQ